MILPRLHVVTDDAVLAGPQFTKHAARILDTACIAFHVRGHHTDGATLFRITRALLAHNPHDSLVLVNDRTDIALAASAHGVQLGACSASVRATRELLVSIPAGRDMRVGYSAHDPAEAAGSAREGADFVFAGTIWETATHPGARAAGTSLLDRVHEATSVPVIAIGGVTPERIADAFEHGATGVALLSGIWNAVDPAASVVACIDSIEHAANRVPMEEG
jgi:thiazole tautomerase (transcriptional regulator TenI)